jgi:hypothetical protein
MAEFLVFVFVVGSMPPRTLAQMSSTLLKYGRPLASFKKGDRIRGTTTMALRKGYTYTLREEPGDLPADFRPELSPGEMLMLGVFEGKYLNDCIREFPAEWFMGAMLLDRLSPGGPDPVSCNLFGVKSRLPLAAWKESGWAPSLQDHNGILANPTTNPDERGWFQWYCRYWMGRRIPDLDAIQIRRWKSFTRHAGAIRANCAKHDLTCRPRERQALLQWAYNPFI